MSESEQLTQRADVVVIGAGIMGAATAYYLAKRNADVVLLEKGEIGDEQSNRAWGFVRQQGRDPAELPLMVAANKMWPELSAELETDLEWTQKGILAVADTEQRLEQFRMWVQTGREYGVDTRIVSGNEIRELIPAMHGSFVGGMYTPSDGHAEPTKVPKAFADAARKLGATIHEHCAVEDIESTNGRVSAVHTDRGTIQTSTVICAAGAWSSKLIRRVGLDLPQVVVKNTAAETAPAPHLTDIAVSVRGGGLAFRQRPGGTVYISTIDSSDYDLTLDSFRYMRWFLPNYRENRAIFRMHVGTPLLNDIRRSLPGSGAKEHPFAGTVFEPEPNLRIVGQGRRKLIELFPQLEDIKIRRVWAGRIDTTPDAIPVLGEVDSPKGLVLATGFSGHGFALGPVVGLLMSELVLDGQPFIDISALRPSRFAEGEMAGPRSVI